MRTSKKLIAISALLSISSVACVEVGIPASGNKPHAELNPVQGMHASPSYKDQEKQLRFDAKTGKWLERGMRTPAPKSVANDYRPYRYSNNPNGAKELKNPVAITSDSLRYGQLMYETTCVVCHGPMGNGNGSVVGTGKYPMPPTLNSPRARNMGDGEIYHIITHGTGRMWSYKNQLYPVERWAAINYIRALQRADYPEPQDLERTSETN